MPDKTILAKHRAEARRPMTTREIPYAVRLGKAVKMYRLMARVTVTDMAELAELSVRSIYRIEQGTRRTRESTLLRISTVLTRHLNVTAGELTAEFVHIAGKALAPESSPEFQVKIDRRRELRTRKKIERIIRHQQTVAIMRRIRRAYPKPMPWLLKGIDGKFLPHHPTPAQLKVIERRYASQFYVLPPLKEDGSWDTDHPWFWNWRVNAQEFGARRRVEREKQRQRDRRNAPK